MELIMKKTSRILALLLSLVAVFSLFGCGSKDADGDSSDDNTVYTISWAHSSSTNDRLALATEKMAAELEEASGGRLKIEHYPRKALRCRRNRGQDSRNGCRYYEERQRSGQPAPDHAERR